MKYLEVFDINKNNRLKRYYTDGLGLTRVW